jgi:NADH-quinone oxidoreductase subunit H
LDTVTVVINVVKSVVLIVALLTGFAYSTLFERRVIARMQARLGPDRAGPTGLLQPVADGLKLIFKENVTPAGADRFVYFLAPVINAVVAVATFAVIPVAAPLTFTWHGVTRTVPMQVADINVAVLYVLGVSSLTVYGIALAGWSSDNKYALMGGLRSSAQLLSYELAMGLSLVGVVMLAGTLSIRQIVDQQVLWPYAFLQPLGFLLYAVTAVAETNRAPFDMPEAEQELIAGYHTEYTGMRFALFYMAEYISMLTVSAIAVSLFWGGYRLPCAPGTPLAFMCHLPWIVGPLVFLAKVVVCMYGFVWLRATFPRLRYDRLMALGWKALLPLALVNVVVTAVLMVWWLG